jgi:hypothetical protein
MINLQHSTITTKTKQLLRSFMKYLFERNAPVLNTSHSIDTFLSRTATMLETFVFYYFRSEKRFLLPYKRIGMAQFMEKKKTKHEIVNYSCYHALHKLENVLKLANTQPV